LAKVRSSGRAFLFCTLQGEPAGCQEGLREKPRQLTPFGFRMFKIITRAKANPAKSDNFTLYRGDNQVIFFLETLRSMSLGIKQVLPSCAECIQFGL
jgi:hypothetical protein